MVEGRSKAGTPSRYIPRVGSGWESVRETLLPVAASIGTTELSFIRTRRTLAVVATLALTATFGNGVTREQASPRADAELRAALARLSAEVDAETVEDGITHPAESVLASHIVAHGTSGLFEAMFADDANHSGTASLLRLMGRISVPQDARLRFVRTGLSSPSVEVRDAAVQAAESWADASLVPAIRAHCEPVAWLASYMAAVARDLEA